MRGKLLLLPVLVFVGAACERERVLITVEPKADGSFVRTLRIWREDSERPGAVLPPSPAAVDAALAVHERPVPSPVPAGPMTFRGTFCAVPADLAPREAPNRGAYDAFRTAAGWCGLYRERRPGPIDFAARFEAAARAIDLGARLQIALARKVLAGEEVLPAVVAKLDGPWRRDMRDVLLMLMTSARAEPSPFARLLPPGFEALPDETFLLALERMEEGGYLRLPDLMAVADARLKDRRAVFLRAWAAGLLGRPVDDALWARLASLAEGENLEAEVKEALDAMGMTAEEVAKTLAALGLALRHLNRGAVPTFEIELVLPPGAECLATTGEVGAAGSVLFRDELSDGLVRDVFVTVFTVADEAWQRERFGSVLLRGERLRSYACCLSSLPPAEAGAFEAAAGALAPGPDLEGRVRALGTISKAGARILCDALEAGK